MSVAELNQILVSNRLFRSNEQNEQKEPLARPPLHQQAETRQPLHRGQESRPQMHHEQMIYLPQEEIKMVRPKQEVNLPCRSIRFGSYRTVPHKNGFIFNESGTVLVVKEDVDELWLRVDPSQSSTTPSAQPSESQRKPFALTISWRHIVKVEYVLHHQVSAVFLTLREYAAKKIRDTFNLKYCTAGDDRFPYYDPESKETYHKYITIILSSKSNDWVSKISEFIYKAMADHDVSIDFVELPFAKGNKQLSDSVPPSAKCLFGANSKPPTPKPPILEPAFSTPVNGRNTPVNGQNSTENGRFNLSEARKRVQNCTSVGDTLKRLRSEENLLRFDDGTLLNVKVIPSSSSSPTVTSLVDETSSNSVDSPVRRILTRRFVNKDKELPSKLFVFPSTSESCDYITVSRHDLDYLVPDEFLNDTILDFYLKYVLFRVLSEDVRSKTYIFNSFFWHKLTTKQRNAVADSPTRQHRAVQQHKRVRTWTKNVNIFEKDFVIIPINENAHWYLAIICYPGLTEAVYDAPTIILKDCCDADGVVSNGTANDCVGSISSINDVSGLVPEPALDPEDDELDREEAQEERKQWALLMASQSSQTSSNSSTVTLRKIKMPCVIVMDSLWTGSPRYKTVGILRDYLTEEYASKYPDQPRRVFDRTTFKGFYPKVPQQDNFSDCGVYVLQYAESFLTHPPDDYSAAGLKNMENWFTLDSIKTKRTDILDVMMKLTDEYSKEKKPDDSDGGDADGAVFTP